jgi:hypothetical protein
LRYKFHQLRLTALVLRHLLYYSKGPIQILQYLHLWDLHLSYLLIPIALTPESNQIIKLRSRERYAFIC